MKSIYISTIASWVFVGVFLITPHVFAAEIRLDSHKLDVVTGEQFVVDVMVSSQESLNALEGKIIFPEELVSLVEVMDGNSVINFWISKPFNEGGEIAFSGIAPGGFSGSKNLIFSILFEAKNSGMADLKVGDILALRNDGLGTEELFSIRNVGISIKLGDSNLRKVGLVDLEPPEDFVPIISSDKNLFDGRNVLIFATQDKGSGLDFYEVKEYRWPFLSFLSSWRKTVSPHVLMDQDLKSYILVRATDLSQNERISVVSPSYPLVAKDYLRFIGVAVMVLVSCFFIFKFKTTWKEN